MGRRNLWTPEDEKLAKELLAQGATPEEYPTRLGRTRAACYAHFYFKRGPSSGKRASFKSRPNQLLLGDGDVGSAHQVWPSERPSEELLAEARARASIPRTTTQAVCGDPPPGHSALDKLLGSGSFRRE